MKKLMFTTTKKLKITMTAKEYAQLISSTKNQLDKAVPAPLRPERQVLPTEKSSGPPLLNRIVNISQLTRLLLTMAQDFRRS